MLSGMNPFDRLLSAEVAGAVVAGVASMPGVTYVPEPALVQQLLGSCVAASLERDEGRQTTFTMCLGRPTDAKTGFLFREPLKLEPAAVRRLGAALDPNRGYICVAQSPSGSLEIVGLLVVPGHREVKQGHGAARALCVRVFGAGVLTVKHTGKPLLVHRREQTRLLGEHYASVLLLATKLPAANLVDPAGVHFFTGKYLAESMVGIGHGGTLLVIPEGIDWERELEDPRSRLIASEPFTVVGDSLSESSQHERAKHNMPDEAREHVAAADKLLGGVLDRQLFLSSDNQLEVLLDWVARLTATDGMTILRSDLTLLAFGVIIEAGTNETNTRIVCQGPLDDVPSEVLLEDLGGARHQSAARACIKLKGAVAFVASQDGGLTTMRWDEKVDALIVTQNLELLL